MKIVLLGPPGAGKGTLAGAIKKQFSVTHISTGDILREEMKSGSDLGNRVKSFVESGGLVPDEVVTEIIEKQIKQLPKDTKGYMLDGFPRTTQQATDLDGILKENNKPLDFALYMEAGLPVIIKRLTGRRVCRNCQALYHTQNMPPKAEGICDKCGGELYLRPDDNEETIKKRMDVYMANTAPIIDYYNNLGKLQKVNAEQGVQEVLNHLIQIANEDKSTNQDKDA